MSILSNIYVCVLLIGRNHSYLFVTKPRTKFVNDPTGWRQSQEMQPFVYKLWKRNWNGCVTSCPISIMVDV
jgi:hypothetical protein